MTVSRLRDEMTIVKLYGDVLSGVSDGGSDVNTRSVKDVFKPSIAAISALDGGPCIVGIRASDNLLQRRTEIIDSAVLIIDEDCDVL